MKECELCNFPARLYCESDQASLCVDCDAKVHSANFLVARHSRTLLCHTCQSPTPWKASGPRFGPTVSVCNRCFVRCETPQRHRHNHREEADGESEDDVEDEDDNEDDEEEEEEEDEEGDHVEYEGDEAEDEEDGENQVVPWSSTPPPPTSSSSEDDDGGEDDSTSRSMDFSFKRRRETGDLFRQDDVGCSSSSSSAQQEKGDGLEETSLDRFGPLMMDRKRKGTVGSDSIQRFHKFFGGDDVVDIRKMSGDSRTADLVSTASRDPPI